MHLKHIDKSDIRVSLQDRYQASSNIQLKAIELFQFPVLKEQPEPIEKLKLQGRLKYFCNSFVSKCDYFNGLFQRELGEEAIEFHCCNHALTSACNSI